MAIKGKGRTRGRRIVAAPPRPQLMVRKKPLYARRWVWAAVALAVLAALSFLIWRTVQSRAEEARQEREARAVQTYSNLVQRRFPPDTQTAPPNRFLLFPTLIKDLDKLGKGRVPGPAAAKAARNFGNAAKDAAEGIDAIDVTRVIPEEFPETRIQTLDSQFLMVQSFRLYQNIAKAMGAAAEASGRARQQFIARAKQLVPQANALFNRGEQKLINIRVRLGIQTILPPQPQPPGG